MLLIELMGMTTAVAHFRIRFERLEIRKRTWPATDKLWWHIRVLRTVAGESYA